MIAGSCFCSVSLTLILSKADFCEADYVELICNTIRFSDTSSKAKWWLLPGAIPHSLTSGSQLMRVFWSPST